MLVLLVKFTSTFIGRVRKSSRDQGVVRDTGSYHCRLERMAHKLSLFKPSVGKIRKW